MRPDDARGRSRWSDEPKDAEALPEFLDPDENPVDLGPSRAPRQDIREFSFLPDEEPETLPVAPESPARRAAPPEVERPTGGLPEGVPLIGVLAYFGVGGLALIVTGFLLGGIGGALLVLFGLACVVGTGFATWQTMFVGKDSAGVGRGSRG